LSGAMDLDVGCKNNTSELVYFFARGCGALAPSPPGLHMYTPVHVQVPSHIQYDKACHFDLLHRAYGRVDINKFRCIFYYLFFSLLSQRMDRYSDSSPTTPGSEVQLDESNIFPTIPASSWSMKPAKTFRNALFDERSRRRIRSELWK
jgi:hypothetical protein